MVHNTSQILSQIHSFMNEDKYHIQLLSEFIKSSIHFRSKFYPSSDQHLFVKNLLEIFYQYTSHPDCLETFDFYFKPFYDFVFDHFDWSNDIKKVKDELFQNSIKYDHIQPIVSSILISEDKQHCLVIKSKKQTLNPIKCNIENNSSHFKTIQQECLNKINYDISHCNENIYIQSIWTTNCWGEKCDKTVYTFIVEHVPQHHDFGTNVQIEWIPIQDLTLKTKFKFLDQKWYENYI